MRASPKRPRPGPLDGAEQRRQNLVCVASLVCEANDPAGANSTAASPVIAQNAASLTMGAKRDKTVVGGISLQHHESPSLQTSQFKLDARLRRQGMLRQLAYRQNVFGEEAHQVQPYHPCLAHPPFEVVIKLDGERDQHWRKQHG
jgi:hypothetical protein